ncbi:MAG: TRAP transporter large permease subunit [Oscillatoriales cyanobacterium]|nr:MAG: TRAP transporter large permease subunit [Oscillatoriales cyanobacterium]
MIVNLKQMAKELRTAPILSECSVQELARVVPYAVEHCLEDGEILFQSGSPALMLYFVRSGKVQLLAGSRVVAEVEQGFVGEEAAVSSECYMADAVAIGATEVIALPREAISKVTSASSEALDRFYTSLLSHYGDRPIKPSLPISPIVQLKTTDWVQSCGWILSVVVPVLLYLWLRNLTEFDWNSQMFLLVLSSTIVMWVFGMVPEFIPGLFCILSLLILDIAPSNVILAGFASGSFFMALSLFGLGAVLMGSGLTYRLVLWLSRYIPKTEFWYAVSMFVTGLLMTPILPSANGRIGLLGPILSDTIDATGIKQGSRAATHLSFAAFSGASLLSHVFLSSKSANFVVYGLLPIQSQQQFSWIYWLQASLVIGLATLVLYFLSTFFLFRNRTKLQISRQQVEAQVETLGPLSSQEWISLISTVILLLGIVTASIHKIQLPWIGLGVLFLVLAFGLLKKNEFRTQIDWPFLILLGSLVGISEAMSYLGLDTHFGSYLTWLSDSMKSNFSLFIFLLSVTILVVRFVIPNTTAVAIFATILIPMSEANGVNPWLIGAIILNISDAWFFPYQCSYYLQFQELLENRPQPLFNEKLLLKGNFLSTVIRFLSIYLSLGYLRYMGIL